ncbi:MAG: phage tail fiber protein [Gammaproteobacteria bacterium]|nr:phage tail fiber protein [Gammaproteobacteria bacterium]
MAHSIKEYDYNGEAIFTTPDYIEAADITVSVAGVELTKDTDYTLTQTSLKFDLSYTPVTDDKILIVRKTNPAERIVNYENGSVLKAETLDKDSKQLFFMAQEAIDAASVTNLAAGKFYHSSDIEPTDVDAGTLWYNTANDPNVLSVYNGSSWVLATPVHYSDTIASSQTSVYVAQTFVENDTKFTQVPSTNFVTFTDTHFTATADLFINSVAMTSTSDYAAFASASDNGNGYYFHDTANNKVYVEDLITDEVIEIKDDTYATFEGNGLNDSAFVFLNGVRLIEADSFADIPTNGDYYYDIATNTVYIQTLAATDKLVMETYSGSFSAAGQTFSTTSSTISTTTGSVSIDPTAIALASEEVVKAKKAALQEIDQAGTTSLNAITNTSGTGAKDQALVEIATAKSGALDAITKEDGTGAQQVAVAAVEGQQATSVDAVVEVANDAATNFSNSVGDARNYAINEKNVTFDDSSGNTAYSALHYAEKANDSSNTSANKAADAQNFAESPEDAPFDTSSGSIGKYSALHYMNKAEEQKASAEVAKQDAHGYAFTAKDTLFVDSLDNSVYSAKHYAEVAQFAANSGSDKLNGWAVIDNETVKTTGIEDPEFISSTTFSFEAPDGMTVNGVPLPTYGGVLTLGSLPSWDGSSGIGVSRFAQGIFKISFSSAFASESTYQVQATLMDTSGTKSFVKVDREDDEATITIVDNLGTGVDVGDITILIYEFT